MNNVTEYEDERLLAELGDAVRAAAQVPERFVAAGKAAFAWRTVDAELAELGYDSATTTETAPVGVRAEQAALRALSFVARELTIEVEVTADALLGQVVPPTPGEVQLQGAGGVAGTAQVDEVGWFSLPVPSGMFRLQVRTTDGRSVVTQWTTL